MRPGVSGGWWATALVTSLLMLLVGPAASASGAASVRLVHAVPGSGAAQLHVDAGGPGRPVGQSVGFGEVGGYASAPPGAVAFDLRLPSGPALSASGQLANRGHYTVLAVGGSAPRLEVLRDGRPRAGGS